MKVVIGLNAEYRMLNALVQFAWRFYKRWLSPMLPGACRFVPTCSEYAAQAVEVHGALTGGALAVWRVLRCQPFARPGHDPVPGLCHHDCDHPQYPSSGLASRLNTDC